MNIFRTCSEHFGNRASCTDIYEKTFPPQYFTMFDKESASDCEKLLEIKKNSMKKLIKSKIKIESIKENNNAFFIRPRYFFLNPSHLLFLKLSISSGIATVKIPKIAMFPKPITIL